MKAFLTKYLQTSKSMIKQTNIGSHYRTEIDGLRCIAILAVVMYHFDFFLGWHINPFKGGYIGVDVFFVISGYVITQSISKSIENNTFSFLSFYSRRIKRLFPAVIVTFILCFIFGYFFLYKGEFETLAKNVLYSMAFIQNFNLSSGTGYFSHEAEVNMLLHFWSLSLEEQFYIIFPALLALLYKFSDRTSRFTLTFSLILFGYTYSDWLSTISPDNNFYLIQSRFFQLLLGVFTYNLRSNYESHISASDISLVVATVGLFLIIYYVVFGETQTSGPSSRNILPVIGSALVLLTANQQGLLGRMLCWKPVSLLGVVSYEIYLLHFPIISGLTIYFGGAENVTTAIKFMGLILCVSSSFLIHYLVTNRIRFEKALLRPVVICLSGYVTVAIAFYLVILFGGWVIPGSFANQQYLIGEQLEGPLWKFHNNKLCLDKYGFEGYEKYGWFFCYLEEDKDPDVVILGNSFANQWLPMINSAEKFDGMNILSYGNNDIRSYFSSIPDHGGEIINTPKEKVILETASVVKNVILPNDHIQYLIITLIGKLDDKYRQDFSRIRELGTYKIILFLPHAKPEWKEINTASCFTRPFGISPVKCSMPISELDQVLSPEDIKEYQDFASSLGDTYIFNPNRSYCVNGFCDFTTGGLPVFRDEYHHLSVHGSHLTLPNFNDFLGSIQ